MIEEHIINLINNKNNSINDIFPLIRELHKSNIIDISAKTKNKNIILDKIILYHGNDDISDMIDFFAETYQNKTFEISEAEYMVQLLLDNLEKLSNTQKYNALNIEKNLISLFKLVPETLKLITEKKSLNIKIGSFALLNLADLVLEKDPNYFNSIIIHIESSDFIEKMILKGANLFSTENNTRKPLYILALDKSEATESLKELIKSKVNPEDLAVEENRSYFSKIRSQSGNDRERMLKSDKNWANIYNEDGISAAIVAISGHKNLLPSLVEIKKALPSLVSLDKEGKGIWFHAKLLDKNNMTTKILNSAAKNIPMKKDLNGYGVLAQYIMDDESSNRYTRESFYLNNKELIEEFGKLIKKGMIDIEGLFGDENSQLKIANFLNKERNYNSASLFFSSITEALVERNEIGFLNSELTGALLLNEYTIDYKKANENVVNTIMEKKFFLELQDIDNIHRIAKKIPESELEGLKRVRRMMEIFVEKEQLGALLTPKVDKKDLKRL